VKKKKKCNLTLIPLVQSTSMCEVLQHSG